MLVLKSANWDRSCCKLLQICCQHANYFSLTKNRWNGTNEFADNIRIMDVLSPYLITTIRTSHWFCNYVPESSPLEVYLYQVNEQSKKIVLEEYDRMFSEHAFLKKPEDICFFSDGKLFFGTVLHERICFAYEENQSFISSIKQIEVWEHQIDRVEEQIQI